MAIALYVMNYPHRGGHCRNRRCDNNSFRPEVGSKDFYINDIFQHLRKNITKPSALKFFGNNFNLVQWVKKSHLSKMAFDKVYILIFL